MKIIILLFSLAIVPLFGSGQKWTWTYLPLYVLNVDEGENTQIVKVEYVASYENAQMTMLNSAYIPPTISYEKPKDTNLVTLYQLKLSMQPASKKDIEANKKFGTITIDTTNAIRPEHYPLTIKQVTEIVTKCLKKNFDEKFYDIELKLQK